MVHWSGIKEPECPAAGHSVGNGMAHCAVTRDWKGHDLGQGREGVVYINHVHRYCTCTYICKHVHSVAQETVTLIVAVNDVIC